MTEQIDRSVTPRAVQTSPSTSFPLSVGAHAAMESAFVILDFLRPDEDPSVVYIDTPSSAAYLQKLGDLRRYETIFGHVLGQAVPILE